LKRKRHRSLPQQVVEGILSATTALPPPPPVGCTLHVLDKLQESKKTQEARGAGDAHHLV
jgi:hypothetical protein